MNDDLNECLCDNSPICLKQAELILKLFRELDKTKTISDMHEKHFKEYFDNVRNEDWFFYEDGCYKVTKFTHDEYNLIKEEDIHGLVIKSVKEHMPHVVKEVKINE